MDENVKKIKLLKHLKFNTKKENPNRLLKYLRKNTKKKKIERKISPSRVFTVKVIKELVFWLYIYF